MHTNNLLGLLQATAAVGSGDFHEKAVKVKFWFTCDY